MNSLGILELRPNFKCGSKMPFKKQYTKEDFLSALSYDWQKTREIADKVGCKNLLVTDTLLQMYDIVFVGFLTIPLNRKMKLHKKTQFCVYNSIEVVEFRWVPGGKEGTREWKLKENIEEKKEVK